VSASRRELLAGAASVALALAHPATAAAASDVEQVERLLALEGRLEAAYRMALERDAIDRALGQTLLAHERAHIRGLEQVLGGAERRPQATVPPPGAGAAFAGRHAFARYALELEGRTVAAYEEVLAGYRNERLLGALAAIMTADAQHEVALREVLGADLLGVG
jgi:hypothetical protein